jgi:hypothetical protein
MRVKMSRSYIAKIESNGASVNVYDARTGARIRSVGGSGSPGENVSVQTNADIVVITDRRGVTKTYDAESGRFLRAL